MVNNTQNSLTYILGRPTGSIFKDAAVQEYCLTIEMGPLSCPEMTVTDYQSTLRNIAEEQ